jgi:membrane associated rhomboid family serine protease
LWQYPALVSSLLLASMAAAWLFLQGAGLHAERFASSICDFGLVAGELTGRAALGTAAPLGQGHFCLVDARLTNYLTPLTAIFLHGNWWHLVGNGLMLVIFGSMVERRMGRLRFLALFLLCGVIGAGVHVLADSASSAPTVGASGAIAGILGAYLVLYGRAVPVHGWMVLGCWLAWQLVSGIPQLLGSPTAGATAVWAHIGGLLAGALLAKPFTDTGRASASLPNRTQPEAGNS